jgi:hypothetical protein
MADFSVRSDSVDVEQIMRQIRARIREKRGADYTEAEIEQLAKVKLEKFLDPRGVRSDLVEQFRRREHTPSPPLPKLELKEFSIYGTHRGLLRGIRQMLQPLLKLFINPNPLVHFVWTQAHEQAKINEEIDRWIRRREQLDAKMDPLYYELLHNLVIELTRTGIEVHNLKMRLESLSSRMDFDERRGRSLERVVEYRPNALQRPAQPQTAPSSPAPPRHQPTQGQPPSAPGPGGRPDEPRVEGDGSGERRRRRRRRRRRPGQTMADQAGRTNTTGATGSPGAPTALESADDAGPQESSADFDDEAPDQ